MKRKTFIEKHIDYRVIKYPKVNNEDSLIIILGTLKELLKDISNIVIEYNNKKELDAIALHIKKIEDLIINCMR